MKALTPISTSNRSVPKMWTFILFTLMYISSIEAQHVGIGTTTPSNPLSVVGDADVTGNVGIGITMPVKKLEVAGDASLHGLTLGRGGGNSIFNTVLGNLAFASNTTGAQNTAIGYFTLTSSNGGNDNVGFGAHALAGNTTGNSNTAVGRNALLSNTSGSLNTAIGKDAGVSSPDLMNATAIGANAVVAASNSLVLGNNVNVGIGTSTPGSKLDVVGNTQSTNFQITAGATNGFVFRSNANGTGSWSNLSTFEVDPKVGAMSTNRVPKWVTSSLQNGILYDDNSNIGIGTTSPIAKLSVQGTNAGIRLWSGSAANFTSFQIGRTSTAGSIGVAAANGNYALGSTPGDVILRTESNSQKVIINSGSGAATLVVSNDKTGIGTPSPVNTLDVEGAVVVGSTYAGLYTAPSNGAIIEGNVGIGTTTPNGNLHVSGLLPKTNTGTHVLSETSTNENIASDPFSLSISTTGGATLNDRLVSLQTHEITGSNGGNIVLQLDGGSVGIGTAVPGTTLDVEGGIRTKYSGQAVITIDFDPFFLGVEYDIPVSPPLPADWNYLNTVVLVTDADGATSVITRARLIDSDTIRILVMAIAVGGPTRYAYTVFKI